MTRCTSFDKYPDYDHHRNDLNDLVDRNGKFRMFYRNDLIRSDHCCDQMFEMISLNDYLRYNCCHREYYIVNRYSRIDCISFCPYCGVRLPEWLSDRYYDELEKFIEFRPLEVITKRRLREKLLDHYSYLESEERKKIVNEWFTDGWWKVRGLGNLSSQGSVD